VLAAFLAAGAASCPAEPSLSFVARPSVAFRINWRNVSELFGVVLQRERDSSRREYGGYSQAKSKYLPIVGATLGSRERDACPSTSVVQTQWYAK
jgi:hypothetical protein